MKKEKATPRSPLTNDVGQKLTRRFLGDLNSLKPQDQRELKAYLKGNEFFVFGRDRKTKHPLIHPVRQEYFYE
mgnify:CR=1 FL=1